MWEPKPNAVAFAATLVLVASTSTAIDQLAVADDRPAVTIEDVAAEQDPADATPEPQRDGEDAAEQPSDAVAAPRDTGVDVAPGQDGPEPADDGDVPTEEQPAGQGPGDAGTGPDAEPDPQPEPEPTPSDDPPPAPAFPEASLYNDTDKRRGITSDEIVLCGHAALALGAAFDTSREDLNVYWDMVNDDGGVLGRDVEMHWEDDAYVSDKAVQAATACADRDPFMILGGIGFDQIPSVRTWAESNRELYMHHIAVAPDQDHDYSFSLSPTVQHVGEESGHYIVREHRDEKVGVIFRDRENWKPGSDAGIAVMEDEGMEPVVHGVFQNQGVYSQQLNDMQLKGVEVVWIWENALIAAQIINQAEDLGYRPTWVVFPFQQTLDLLNNPRAHTIEGVASWSSYAPGGYSGAHSDFRVDEEIARFEAAYAKYRPDTTPNDILWQVWVGNKILHRMFEDCGSGCNRNRFAGMMLSGYQAEELPGCRIDFTHELSYDGHHGGHRFFTQEMVFRGDRPVYRTNDYCAASLR